MTRYLIIGAIIFSLISGIWLHGNYHGRNMMKLKIEQANKKALQEKEKLQEKINEITREQTNKLADIIYQRDYALERLRQRPDRMPKTSETQCKGATGVELSRRDAEFLTRLAARADRLRQALKSCYDYADSISKLNP